MTDLGKTALFGGMILLGACSSPAHREWEAAGDVALIAHDECDDQVDTTMRLRGYPSNPLPETPQFQYRREIFSQCMRRKGYAAD